MDSMSVLTGANSSVLQLLPVFSLNLEEDACKLMYYSIVRVCSLFNRTDLVTDLLATLLL